MKIKKISLFAMTAVLATLLSCGGDSEPKKKGDLELEGISLDQSTLAIDIDASASLVASIDPDGFEGTITWTSSDPTIATVTEGVQNAIGTVTGVAVGTCQIAASIGTFTATAEITVSEALPEHESLNGTDYYVIALDELAYQVVEDEVTHDFRPDGVNKNLYVWDGTFNEGTSVGNNFYGVEQSWVSLVVGNVGWSGAGYNVGPDFGTIDMSNLYDNPEDYYLHMAFKSEQANTSYLFILNDGGSDVKFAVGGSFDDAGVTYTSQFDFDRDGEWYSVDIPVTYLNSIGLYYEDTFSDVNILALLAGGTEGTTLDMDAVFFYKPAE